MARAISEKCNLCRAAMSVRFTRVETAHRIKIDMRLKKLARRTQRDNLGRG
jgi:hypothetical protein